MASELLPFDRRMIIMSMLMHNKKITRRSLAKELSVFYATIGRDLTELSRYIPIYTRMGRYGGIYLSDDIGRRVMVDKAILNEYIENHYE